MNHSFEWSDDFVTGNEELDNEHKQLFQEVNELYEMFTDTKKYHEQIPLITKHLESVMVEHFEIENNLLEKYNISGKEEHIKAHNEMKESICEIKNYKLPEIIAALLLCDIIISYFLNHFHEYDKDFIIELSKKNSGDN